MHTALMIVSDSNTNKRNISAITKQFGVFRISNKI